MPQPEESPHGLTELAGFFVERAFAGFYLIQDDLFRYVNPAFARTFGYTREELIDRLGPADLLLPEDHVRIEETRRRLLEALDPSFHYELRGLTKAGAAIDIELMVTAAPYRGRPAILGTMLDITERKRAEREAAERRDEIEALYRASSRLLMADDIEVLAREIIAAVREDFGHALVTLYLTDEMGRRLEQAACSDPTLGMPLAQPLSDPWIAAAAARIGEILNVADVTADPRLVSGAAHLGSELAVPLRIGERVLGVLDLGGREKGAFSGRDVLVLKAFADRAAAALDRARLLERLRDRTHVLERFHELALTMVGDPREVYRAIARQVAELLGVPYAGLVRIEGDHIRALAMMTPEGIDEGRDTEPLEHTPCRVVQEARDSRIFRDVATLFPRDRYLARERIRTFIGVPILNRRGDVVGVLDALDRHDRSFGADEMRTLNLLARRAAEEMEEEQRAMEKQATERRLLQSEKLASLGQLVAGVAHELNNPLASILGLAELLVRRGHLPEATMVSLRTMVAEAERARSVVRNLLAFAREREPEAGPTSLEEVVSRTLALRENVMRVSGIETVRLFAGDLPVTLADAHLLQQAVLNLILNAEQAMLGAGGHGRLTVRTRFRPDGGSPRQGPTLRLEIEDNGPGIPEPDLGRIFEPFFTTKPVGMGTGLGLSLTHSIVEQHGGTIWAERVPGGGARFVIELPHVAPPAGAVPAVAARAAVPRRLSGRRILVADDEKALREIAREVLEHEGCVVVEADSGRAALERLEAEEFDLVVSDVKMPDLGGLEVYRLACAARPILSRRFLFVTGDWVSEDTARFLRETGCPHLEKPYNVAQLVHKIEELLTGA